MGLDMYAYTRTTKPETPVDFPMQESDSLICCWRKHPNLHGWMEALYRSKNGEEDTFNCTSVELTMDDLDALETAIRAGSLPPTEGFFFGVSDGSEIEHDLAFVTSARDAIASGLSVYYSSWW